MKVCVLAHDLSSNAVMRAHRLVLAIQTFADVTLIGPARRAGPWPALPDEPWVHAVRKRRFPQFAESLLQLIDLADGDVLLAVKPHLASFGAALVAGEQRGIPVVLDVDDLDVALAPRSTWSTNPIAADVSRPASAVYVSLLTRAAGGAAAVTAASTALARRFGGTLVPHGVDLAMFDPEKIDREAARRRFGFSAPTVLFPGTPREHKGVEVLARAVASIPGATLAVTCRPGEMEGPPWDALGVQRVPLVPYDDMPSLLAAADVVAVPQLDTEAARHQMPIKVYDAMAMARPVVATPISDLPHLLDGCGTIVAAGDAGALAGALHELLDDATRAEAMGRAARARVAERYSTEAVGGIMRGVLAAVTG